MFPLFPLMCSHILYFFFFTFIFDEAHGLNQKYDEIPVESQSAQCTITAGDVQASAEATMSKKLEGVCGTCKFVYEFYFFVNI